MLSVSVYIEFTSQLRLMGFLLVLDYVGVCVLCMYVEKIDPI